jgi:hypothetical protein
VQGIQSNVEHLYSCGGVMQVQGGRSERGRKQLYRSLRCQVLAGTHFPKVASF